MVYATGATTQFGRIAAGLGERPPETDFQAGLRRFSYLLLWVALTLTVLILVTNLLLRRPVIDSVLFALAIAVGITPQLLPAVVSTSLATGSRRLAQLKVLVKRLVCIEDLGDIDVLITDKTGTLTEGRISLVDAVDPTGAHADVGAAGGLLSHRRRRGVRWRKRQRDGRCAVGVPASRERLTVRHRPPSRHTAVRSHPPRDVGAVRRRRRPPAGGEGRTRAGAGQVRARCPTRRSSTLAALFADGRRVVAVASKPAPG